MRSLAHFLSILFALPQVLICVAFLLLGHMTGGGTLWSLLKRTVDVFFTLFTWGGLSAVVFLIVLLGAGFAERTRRAAAATVAAIVIMSAVLLIVQIRPPLEDAVLFAPGLFSLVLSVTLALSAPLQSPPRWSAEPR